MFDCANRCGRTGVRFIAPEAHLRMMSAAQPFISGAISKTINMPHESTVDEISDAYLLSWKLGLKATALYRDGCKASQPLSARSSDPEDEEHESAEETAEREERAKPSSPKWAAASRKEADLTEVAASSEVGVENGNGEGSHLPPPRTTRRPLPAKRRGFTQEARVGGHKIYLRTGEYEDGTPGEIFVDMHKEGAAFRAIMNCFAIAVSKGLQYGVPLEEFVETFTFTRFAPQGQVMGHPNIKMATSIVDYLFRVLGLEYLNRTDFVHVQPAEIQDLDPAEKGLTEGNRAADPSRAATAGESVDPAGELAVESSRPVESSRSVVGESADCKGEGFAEEATSNGSSSRLTQSSSLEPSPSLVVESRFSQRVTVEEGDDYLQFSYDDQLEEFMGDAPPCEKCGHTTIRSGSCYRCLVCGESMGCS